jgi:hypothetical protein
MATLAWRRRTTVSYGNKFVNLADVYAVLSLHALIGRHKKVPYLSLGINMPIDSR